MDNHLFCRELLKQTMVDVRKSSQQKRFAVLGRGVMGGREVTCRSSSTVQMGSTNTTCVGLIANGAQWLKDGNDFSTPPNGSQMSVSITKIAARCRRNNGIQVSIDPRLH
jgi:hypothetical protein